MTMSLEQLAERDAIKRRQYGRAWFDPSKFSLSAAQERIARQARLDGEREALLDWVASEHIRKVKLKALTNCPCCRTNTRPS